MKTYQRIVTKTIEYSVVVLTEVEDDENSDDVEAQTISNPKIDRIIDEAFAEPHVKYRVGSACIVS